MCNDSGADAKTKVKLSKACRNRTMLLVVPAINAVTYLALRRAKNMPPNPQAYPAAVLAL
jgi:hypothetical protein